MARLTSERPVRLSLCDRFKLHRQARPAARCCLPSSSPAPCCSADHSLTCLLPPPVKVHSFRCRGVAAARPAAADCCSGSCAACSPAFSCRPATARGCDLKLHASQPTPPPASPQVAHATHRSRSPPPTPQQRARSLALSPDPPPSRSLPQLHSRLDRLPPSPPSNRPAPPSSHPRLASRPQP